MGGFAGGDEAGYWDTDTISSSIDKTNDHKNRTKSYIKTSDSGYSIRAHAKVNIFLKVTDYKDGQASILSRFMRVEKLFDTISFVPSKSTTFTIEGCDEIPLESNSIYKAYTELMEFTDDSDISDFFCEHKVVVTKGIPFSAGLGGASSDAASFILLVKEACSLVLNSDELVKIGSKIGADVPFFISNYSSANVSGFGEIVEHFEEEPLNLELYTPEIRCDGSVVYKTFKKHLLSDTSSLSDWEKLDSKSILNLTLDPAMLNDLYTASLLAYPDLKEEVKNGWFISGSGSTFFKYQS